MVFDGQDPWGSKGSSSGKQCPANDRSNDGIEKILKKMQGFIFPGGNGSSFSFNKIHIMIAVVSVFMLYLSSGFYIVQTEEEGVELVFGKYSNTTYSGLRYHFPSPIGKVSKVKVTAVNREEIGSRAYASEASDRNEGVMLTGDENIVNINFEVQWRVNSAYDYLFKVRDSRQGATVKNAAESAMREVVGKSTISFAIEGKGRAAIAQETKLLLQRILDQYQMGVEVLSIQLKKVDPPEKVISAFRDVQSARADKERLINEARSYSNDILPRAKGEAIRIKMDAEGYESEVVNMAEGNAKRFISLHTEYKNQPESVKKRMYLETMESVLANTEKMVVSDDLKGLMSYLPLAGVNGGVK